MSTSKKWESHLYLYFSPTPHTFHSALPCFTYSKKHLHIWCLAAHPIFSRKKGTHNHSTIYCALLQVCTYIIFSSSYLS